MESLPLLTTLQAFPLLHVCFAEYVAWVCRHHPDVAMDHELVGALAKHETHKLEQLQSLLAQSRDVLAVSELAFVRMFGFNTDLLARNPEKLHDLLAEALFVVDLRNLGFIDIARIVPHKLPNGDVVPAADFTARRRGKVFAIEVKTVRTESWVEDLKPMGNGTIPSWWRTMFRQNAVTKIENGNRRALRQLRLSATRYDCECTMLAIVSLRIGPAALMENDDYLEELAFLSNHYPEVNYFAAKDLHGRVSVFPPLDN